MIDPTASLTAAQQTSLTQIAQAGNRPPRTVAELQAFEMTLADALQQLMSPTLPAIGDEDADDDSSQSSAIPALGLSGDLLNFQVQTALANAKQTQLAPPAPVADTTTPPASAPTADVTGGASVDD